MSVKSSSILLDTPALVAILTRESECLALVEKLFAAEFKFLPTPCASEAIFVLRTKLNRDPTSILQDFYGEFDIQLIPFEAHHLPWFHHAFSRFGKGRLQASLNFGDCFTYSISKATGIPILFTGNHFSQTDLAIA